MYIDCNPEAGEYGRLFFEKISYAYFSVLPVEQLVELYICVSRIEL